MVHMSMPFGPKPAMLR